MFSFTQIFDIICVEHIELYWGFVQVANAKRKRISIDKVKVGMCLAEDVTNASGMMLIPNNTSIEQKHIFRLKLYQVLSVVIVEDVIEAPAEKPEIIEEVSVTGSFDTAYQKAFIKFKDTYYEKEETLKQQIDLIGKGEPINITDLMSISNSLMDSLRTRSDLFNYLYHLKSSDDYTYTHSLNVSLLCNVLGHWLHMTNSQIENITVSGLLHDIGKIQISKDILVKPGKLTKEEFEEIKRHTLLGYQVIKDQNISKDIKLGVLMHHEKIDGSGYPQGLKGADIHPFGKLIAIADIYDAMTSNRSYHKKFSPFKVINMFEQESYGLLDTKFLFVFLENIAHNYLGKIVRLSTGEIGKVVFIHNNSPSRPIVQVDNVMIDLIFEPTINIDEII